MPRKDLEHYWPDRVDERNERNTKLTVEEAQKELIKLYASQAKDLQVEIQKVFEKIMADKDTEHGIMINDVYRDDRYWKLLDWINDQLRKLGQKELKITEPALIKVYEDTKHLIDEEAPKQLIKSAFVVPQMIEAKNVVHQTWCLDGEEFSDRIWLNKSKLLTRLKKDMADFLVQGKSPWYIAERLAKDMETSEYNAYRIVRTESAHLQIKGKTDRYQELGFTHGKYLGTNCCGECKKENGKVYTLKELESKIPMHPHCTCTFTLLQNRSNKI